MTQYSTTTSTEPHSRSLSGRRSFGQTVADSNTESGSGFLQIKVPLSTDTSKDHDVALVENSFEIVSRSEAVLPQTDLKKEIKGVVSRVTDESVFISCELPFDTVPLSLSKGLVSEELARYGTPITLSVETVDGYRQPVIRYREVHSNPHAKDYLKEIDAWIETL